ncbi:MAG: ATP-binding cassette domain-containing protein [Zoogloeaceae bacterium]|nr:ATP-binding cassette domain-containing protein [Zoogloeaceae bacterium]
MPLLKLENASLAFGHAPLLERVDFLLDAGERVGLIGRNGMGKSSLLSVLAGQRALDEGRVWRQPGIRVAHVPQEPTLAAEETVFQAVVSGLGEVSRLLSEYHQVSRALADTEDAALLQRLEDLQHALEAAGAWNWQSMAERAISRFALDAEARIDTLSGGQKKRLALARALAGSPQALLLDEPTNHLDIESIEWLETFLLECRASLLFVTHDRRFLERLATRIVELDRGKLTCFPGNFSDYQRRKEALLHEEIRLDKKLDKQLKAEEIWIRKGVEARRTRAAFRVQRLEKLRQARSERRKRMGQAALRLLAGEKSGELVAELQHVRKAFGEKIIVRDFSTRILRGDKVGLIGKNGAGKTTLLRLLLGEIKPDSGALRRGTRQKIAYFDQFRAQLDENASLAEVIAPGSDYVEIGGVKKHVTGYLEDFLFAPERARSPVRTLSGGERNRLLLARLFARPANVLALDEPTNDLDMETLELLEQRLQDYSGTLFLVSHDRAFLDNVVTQTFAAEGDGLWREYVGGFSDWQATRANATMPAVKPEKTDKAAKPAPPAPSAKTDKLSWKEARELAALPEQIAALEAEQSALSARLSDPAFYRQAAEQAAVAAKRLAALEDELTALLERWEMLETRN